jgi:hypothetical protein
MVGVTKIWSLFAVLALFNTFFGSLLWATDFQLYETNSSGATLFRDRSEVTRIELGHNEREKNWLSTYEGHAKITVSMAKKEGVSFTRTINVWFDEREEAQAFVAHMRAHPEQDLYYNLQTNPLNQEVDWEEGCLIPNLPFYCRAHAATIINSENIVASKLFIYNPRNGVMLSAQEHSNDERLSRQDIEIHDGNRSNSPEEIFPSDDTRPETSDSAQSIMV